MSFSPNPTMQLSQLLNPLREEKPKTQPRFCRFINSLNPHAVPTNIEMYLLNKPDKLVFVMLTKNLFDSTSGCIRLTLEQFAVALWKTSLLRQRTRKGRRSADGSGREDILVDNLQTRSMLDFFLIGDDVIENRCMRVWKNLRKYFFFRETGTGWEMHHDVFKCIHSHEQIPSVLKDILPKPTSPKRRTNIDPRNRSGRSGDAFVFRVGKHFVYKR